MFHACAFSARRRAIYRPIYIRLSFRKCFRSSLAAMISARVRACVRSCVPEDDIGDYAKRVRKGRNSRSVMKPEPARVDRQIADNWNVHQPGENGRHTKRENETKRRRGGGEEGGPLDNAVNRESGLSHRARQNTSATAVRSLRNPLTALGVDSPRRRLVGRTLRSAPAGDSRSSRGFNARPTGHDRSRSPISSSAGG